MKILLGPAGSPGGKTLEALKIVSDLGLQAMELSFTHGVTMGLETAKKIREENEKYNISLSIHAPYYINLTSEDNRKIEDSKKRILDTCERGHFLGAKKIIFHAAYYGKDDRETTQERVQKEVRELLDKIEKNSWDVELLPETAGRVKQFGDLDEIIELSRRTKCGICIDPAHLYARNFGKINFSEMFDKLSVLKQKHLHFHFSGIAFGPGGEKNHLTLDSRKPDFAEFAEQMLRSKKDCTVISESPITWKDSLYMKKILEKSGYKFL